MASRKKGRQEIGVAFGSFSRPIPLLFLGDLLKFFFFFSSLRCIRYHYRVENDSFPSYNSSAPSFFFTCSINSSCATRYQSIEQPNPSINCRPTPSSSPSNPAIFTATLPLTKTPRHRNNAAQASNTSYHRLPAAIDRPPSAPVSKQSHAAPKPITT